MANTVRLLSVPTTLPSSIQLSLRIVLLITSLVFNRELTRGRGFYSALDLNFLSLRVAVES